MKMRAVAALDISVTPAPLDCIRPVFEWADPRKLLIDGTYQRDLSARSRRVIKRIVENWNWAHLKPPVCARTKAGLVVIDGQYTAIAAVTHGGIESIPVMVVGSLDVAAQANAFLSHNTVRTNVTPYQAFAASVAAGNEVAVAVRDACRAAGVTIRMNPAGTQGKGYGKDEAICIGALETIAAKKGRPGLERVLRILVGTDRSPITSMEIKAAYHSVYDYGGVDASIHCSIATQTSSDWMSTGMRLQKESGLPRIIALAKFWAEPVKAQQPRLAAPNGSPDQLAREQMLIERQRENIARRGTASRPAFS